MFVVEVYTIVLLPDRAVCFDRAIGGGRMSHFVTSDSGTSLHRGANASKATERSSSTYNHTFDLVKTIIHPAAQTEHPT